MESGRSFNEATFLLLIWENAMGALLQTAMIIDDDPDLGELLAIFLEKRKIYSLIVPTLSEAAGYLGYMKPTVIFLDNSFPDGLGVNFIRDIRSADHDIKIIMITGDSATWIREKAIEEGIDYFICKPFNLALIDALLDRMNFRKDSP